MLKIENVEVVGWEHAIRGMRNPKNSWEKSDSGYHHISAVEPDGEVVQTLAGMPIMYEIGPNDKKLMMTLRNAGTDHRKFMRYIIVYLDITAPLYWWKEFETYRAGVYPGQEPINPMDIEMNSCSTMHKIHAKEFELSDFSCEHLLERESLGVGLYSKINGEYFGIDMSSKGLLELTCETLNIYRSRYLESKDKKWWWQLIQLLPSSYNQKRTVMLNYEVLANMYKSRRNHKLDCWHTLCDWMETLPYSELITGECTPPSTKNTSRVVRHAYIHTIEKGFPDEGPYLRMYTRGYKDDNPGLGAKNTIDAVFLIDPDDIPFEKGALVKVVIEEE